MREAKIILPLNDNQGEPMETAHSRLQKTLCTEFGGFTAQNATGGYVNQAGETQIEDVTIYFIAIQFKDWPKMQNIARDLIDTTDQESIYLGQPNGCGVEFIDRNHISTAA